jgi:hypothetical protein
MAVRIHLKSGSWYEVNAHQEDVDASWRAAISEGTTPIVTYKRVDGGIPRPKITIDLREIEHTMALVERMVP